MEYVLGIDSGGTKYLVRAASLSGEPLGSFEGPTCSHYSLPYAEARRRIDENISRCLATFGGRREACRCILSGSTGYDSEEDGEILRRLYRSLEGFDCPVYCMNDAELAHYTATDGVGVLLIAGTGSIAFGRNARGETLRVGGWPLDVMGEEGSGRYVDAWALHHYTRYLDGVRERTALIEEMEKVLGAMGRKQMMDYAMALYAPPWESPGLGRAVNAAAEAGDSYAQRIMERAAACGFELVDELVRALGFDREAAFDVGVWGSTIVKGRVQREAFARILAERYPQARLVIASRDAAQGAVCWALERIRK